MTDNTAGLLKLFNLKENEKILDDFGCALSDTILFHGRMFLTENYICFNSNLFAIEKKFKLKSKNIKSINKKKNILSDNSIEIVHYYTENRGRKERSSVFTSFSNRDGAYSRICDIVKIKSNSESARGIYSSDEDEPDSRTIATINSVAMVGEDGGSGDNIQKQDEEKEIDIDIEEILLKHSNVDWIEFPKYIVDCTFEQYFESFIKDQAINGYNAFCESNSRTDIDITKWKKNEREPDQGNDLMTAVNDLCMNKALIQSENQQELSNLNELNNQVYLRFSCCRDKVKGVPFINSTRVHKFQKLVMKGSAIVFSTSTRSIDTPYADYFFVDDIFEIYPYHKKCLVRSLMMVHFVKSTYFKSTIEARVKEEYPKEVAAIKEYIGKKYSILTYSPHKQNSQLMHGLTKDSAHLVDTPALETKKLKTYKDIIAELICYLIRWFASLNSVQAVQITLLLLLFIYMVLINSKLNRLIELGVQLP